jgi:hypothetical protein
MSGTQKISTKIFDPIGTPSQSEIDSIKENESKLIWLNNCPNSKDTNIILGVSAIRIFSICTIIFTAFFGLVGCNEHMYSRNQAEYMEKNADKIKINMTKKELKDMFGKPDSYAPKIRFFYDDEGLEKASSWLYLYPDGDCSHRVDFDPLTGRVIKAEKESDS